MRFSLKSRTKSTHGVNWTNHPDLDLHPASSQRPPNHNHNHHHNHDYDHKHLPLSQHTPASLTRSASARLTGAFQGDRRSVVGLPVAELAANPAFTTTSRNPSAEDDTEESPPSSDPTFSPSGLGRAHTVHQHIPYTAASPRHSQHYHTVSGSQSPSSESKQQRQPQQPAHWPPDFAPLPSLAEQQRADASRQDQTSMSGAQQASAPKTSSDSGQNSILDRWSQRRLQRLNTEQGFREQRQGGQSAGSTDQQQQQPANYNNNPGAVAAQQQQQHILSQQQETQPQSSTPIGLQPSQQQQQHPPGSYPVSSRTALSNPSLAQPSRSSSYPSQDPVAAAQVYSQSQPQYPLPDTAPQYHSQDPDPRTSFTQARSYSQQNTSADEPSMSSANNGTLPTSKSVRSSTSNRQSVYNGFSQRDSSSLAPGQPGQQQQPGIPAFNASVVPTTAQTQQRGQDMGRSTPQPSQPAEDMSEEEVTQLLKDHKELREKYTKVKKYYFEKEDQVKQLQNSLAHQRLSQSRTSLDDSEYATRFNRLDGLIAQLAFSIRKSWRTIPPWLINSVNKDAVATGKQEMTAAGRAFISFWLVEEVFNKYFHPDLEPTLSAHLKAIQLNIRRFATPARNTEEDEYLTSKVVNWRLATLEGLQDALRSPQCAANRAQLTEVLKEHLIGALAAHLEDPPRSDLEGGVNMITELVVSIAIHLPVESRDVVIEYFPPGYSILPEQMKVESGIPPLTVSVADDTVERGSTKSATSDITDGGSAGGNIPNNGAPVDQPKKRSMLGALTGSKKTAATQGKHASAGGSSSSLNRPESVHGATVPTKEEGPPRVRMAAGVGVSIRGRGVLVKAPVFST
ncbi:Hypothetical protein R9X50_00634800 [Acrodontium crateriforme]|uniref:Uncharacterized protein n=1 Tax=Acrodontium crateriforme TaxID=150365 RepID=A0AAQ3M9W4_9PEZI|nr:Hypothetical protein R9X50_00634800 [Acrodontium crateriforme]